ncbi:MAG: transposase [Candidatus Kaiserbacteria bacterium]|nr:MAG: transposase [Candidatus Kaiserbacteria bacterium]
MEFYHALNRGVEGRKLFLDDRDRFRFVHDLWEFNDSAPAPEFSRYRDLRNPDTLPARERIVDIHGWCLMSNHYHLLLSECREGGLSYFLRKLNVGYANYFNERYERQGSLFQGRTKKILIASDAHFLHILHYIHLNPLDFLRATRDWRAGRIVGRGRAIEHLQKYRWSSYLDYCSRKNFPSVVTTELFVDVFKNYEKVIRSYLQDMEFDDVRPLLLE